VTIVSELERAIAGLRGSGKAPGRIVAQGSRLTFEVPDSDVLPKRQRAHKAAEGKRGPRGGRTEIQSLLLARPQWTLTGAKRWAKKHGYRYGQADVTAAYIRLRQASPSKFMRLRTIEFAPSIKAVVGVR
jgi:hypothetical protein